MKDIDENYELKYGFIHQKNHKQFDYSKEYKESQSTNVPMSYLRMGFLNNFFTLPEIKKMIAVDIGAGNNCFVETCKKFFKMLVGYDVGGNSEISKELLFSTDWDLIVLSDVLEHFEDIMEVFDIKWKYMLLSYPETPMVDTFEELKKWRHFKPDEHLWYFTYGSLCNFFISRHCDILQMSHVEDLIRTRWDDNQPNITTVLVKRNG